MKRRVLILGYGEMGHAMEFLLADHHDVRIWEMGHMVNGGNETLEQEVAGTSVVLFCLPVAPHNEITLRIAPWLANGSLCLTIAKGLDEFGQTACQVFEQIFSTHHDYGVIYGPMISEEIRAGRYAFADIVLSRAENYEIAQDLFRGSTLVCRQASDMSGRNWCVILKNVYAILFGVADELGLGDNMRGHLLVAALAELSGIVRSFGGQAHTPYGYAGLGDLLTTATSEDSHHHMLGRQLARGEYSDISGEGVHTLQMVEKFDLFDWRSYPLFSLARDIVMHPNCLETSMTGYLNELKAAEICSL
ncbi:MAG: hypothetical protein WA632_01190 [Gallionella sp.]